MPLKSLALALLMTVFCTCAASAQTIGVVSPRSGPYATLGTQILRGARAAAKALGATLKEIDESCEPGTGLSVSEQLITAKAEIAVGFLCVETLSEALPRLRQENIAAITVAVRSQILMEDALRRHWPLFRLAPSEDGEAEKLAATILDLWKADPIALVDDGTIYGRELIGDIRQRIGIAGITPVFTDTFRPGQEQQIALVRRLAKAGATRIVVGGDRHDIAVIARDALAEKLALTVLGGDALNATDRPVPLSDGVLAVTLPDYASLAAAAAAVKALRAAGIAPEGYVLPAYAAVEVAHQALADKGDTPVSAAIAAGSFETAIGTIAFGDNRELRDNPYRLLEWRNAAFHPFAPRNQ